MQLGSGVTRPEQLGRASLLTETASIAEHPPAQTGIAISRLPAHEAHEALVSQRLPASDKFPADGPADSVADPQSARNASTTPPHQPNLDVAPAPVRTRVSADLSQPDVGPTGRGPERVDADREAAVSEQQAQGSGDHGRHSPRSEPSEAGLSGLPPGEDGVGIAASRRTVSIRSKDWAGSVVWAKLAKYPWWPAQVLEQSDPWIPNDTEMPRPGAIPVRFFGTYDFAWIESQRAICPFDQDFEEHSSKSKQKAFTDALAEASTFLKTQELPEGFNEESTPSPQKAPKRGRGTSGKGKGKRGEASGGGKGSKRGVDDGPAHRRSVRERQDSIMQSLALMPPPDSPYSHSINLDGVRKLIELQKAGQYPPPVPSLPPPQPFAAPHGFPAPFSAAQFAAAAAAAQQLPNAAAAQQQLQQQLQQLQQQVGAQRPQWPLHFQAFNGQLPMSFFQAQGGVQGALLAAASQGQFQPKQF